jgi:hypothetical protein
LATAIQEQFGNAPVTLHGRELCVDHWQTDDDDIVRHFQDRLERPADRQETDLALELQNVLKIGVVALRSVPLAVDVDYVQREIQRQLGRLEESIDERNDAVQAVFHEMLAPDSGQFARELKVYFGAGGRLAALFDPNLQDSAVTRIREMLRQAVEGRDSKLGRLLDHTNPEGPIYAFHQDTHNQFKLLRQLLEDYRKEVAERSGFNRGQVEATEKGALKGRVFQEAVFDAVAEIAKAVGDQAEPTWDERAVNGAKTGDIIVTIRTGSVSTGRFVFEAKDGAVGLTPICRQLEGSREARQARAAIAVFSKTEHMPRGSSPFHEVGDSDFLVLYDKDQPDTSAIRLAYHAARRFITTTASSQASQMDAAGLKSDISAARALLRSITNLKSQLTQLSGSVGKASQGISGELDALRRSLSDLFDTMEARVQETES